MTEDEPRLTWVVDGQDGMGMLGYAEDSKEPVVRLRITPRGHWTFQFREFGGSGRVQVRAGDDYNPLDIIESLYAHLSVRRESGMDAGYVKAEFEAIEFDSEVKEDWA